MNSVDLLIRITRTEGDGYAVLACLTHAQDQKIESGTLPAFDPTQVKFADLALRNAILSSDATRGPMRRVPDLNEQPIRDYGAWLFDALFSGAIGQIYEDGREVARSAGLTLRIRFSVDAPELAGMAWEFMFDTRRDQYLCLDFGVTFVRFLEIASPAPAVPVTQRLRILGIAVSPPGLDPLDIDDERKRITEALDPLQGLVDLHWLERNTVAELISVLGQVWHVLHFVGHGNFDRASDEGGIMLVDERGQPQRLSATQLGRVLPKCRSLRLVALNTCEGARSGSSSLFSSTAATAVRRGVPALLAMQYPINDAAASDFGQHFYAEIANGSTVDAAVTSARITLSVLVESTVEWGSPVLYMQTPDGALFDFVTNPAPTPPAPISLANQPGMQSPLPGRLAEARFAVQNLQEMGNLIERSQTGGPEETRFRAAFRQACRRVDVLGDCKDLHNLLHDVQLRCYNRLALKVDGRSLDESDWSEVVVYDQDLAGCIARLPGIHTESTLDKADFSAILQLVPAQRELHRAVDEMDPARLQNAVWLMKQVLGSQPARINQRLVATALELGLPELLSAMQAMRDESSKSGPDPEYAPGLEVGCQSLQKLHMRLERLVDDHNRWQLVDDRLHMLEDSRNLLELGAVWPKLKADIAGLCREPEDPLERPQVKAVRTACALLHQKLGTNDPTRTWEAFGRLRGAQVLRFYTVDAELRHLCGEVRKLDKPPDSAPPAC